MMLRALTAVLAITLATHTSRADTYTVAPNAPGTIQALIDLVLVNGDVIQLEAGTYLLPDEIRIINLDITIRGVIDKKTGEPLSVLDGQGTHRICLTNSAVCNFESLVFTHGNASGDGGAVLGDSNSYTNCVFAENSASSQGGGVYSSSSTFTDCVFYGNASAEYGGGLRAISCTITDCRFTNNSTFAGGGCRASSSTITNCTFANNASDYCGGMYGNNVVLVACAFSENSVSLQGGGLYVYGSATITDCTFVGNSAGSEGGGLFVYDSANLKDCTFGSNSASEGGAIYFLGNLNLRLDLNACTITGNTASGSGGGLWLGELSSTTITDSSICENAPENIVGPWSDGGGNDTCGATPCPADIDNDGVVNSTELGLILALWGTSNPIADLDGDGIVRAGDLGVILGAWGDCPE